MRTADFAFAHRTPASHYLAPHVTGHRTSRRTTRIPSCVYARCVRCAYYSSYAIRVAACTPLSHLRRFRCRLPVRSYLFLRLDLRCALTDCSFASLLPRTAFYMDVRFDYVVAFLRAHAETPVARLHLFASALVYQLAGTRTFTTRLAGLPAPSSRTLDILFYIYLLGRTHSYIARARFGLPPRTRAHGRGLRRAPRLFPVSHAYFGHILRCRLNCVAAVSGRGWDGLDEYAHTADAALDSLPLAHTVAARLFLPGLLSFGRHLRHTG